jgi:hypothetical protein
LCRWFNSALGHQSLWGVSPCTSYEKSLCHRSNRRSSLHSLQQSCTTRFENADFRGAPGLWLKRDARCRRTRIWYLTCCNLQHLAVRYPRQNAVKRWDWNITRGARTGDRPPRWSTFTARRPGRCASTCRCAADVHARCRLNEVRLSKVRASYPSKSRSLRRTPP